MMREILFRGKTTNNGKWVYGYVDYNFNTKIAFMRTPKHIYTDVDMVIPETVGQYTGLTDKNGKKIFEGDIVKITYYSIPDYKETEIRAVTYDESECCYYPMRWKDYCEICDSYTNIDEIEVIGNIHDNPELLGGG